MSISAQISNNMPYLRRYARALTGSQNQGDALVRKTLELIVSDPDLLPQTPAFRVGLYGIFHKIWSENNIALDQAGQDSDDIEKHVQEQLSHVTPISRVALLLTTLEEFDVDQVAHILNLETDEVDALVGDAVGEIERTIITDVLIIEDEPLITLQLEALVKDMGHRVCGTPTTLGEAIESVKRYKPGLILADIQLADGTSGIDAVKYILDSISVPAIFITAFPERLLTGERPEPTFLITKPFLEGTVRVAISQAMFLGSTALPQAV
jgi:DNA-directed RNA polymerase specialized sigma24 family protein/CheY-like chemotaxis protein